MTNSKLFSLTLSPKLAVLKDAPISPNEGAFAYRTEQHIKDAVPRDAPIKRCGVAYVVGMGQSTRRIKNVAPRVAPTSPYEGGSA